MAKSHSKWVQQASLLVMITIIIVNLVARPVKSQYLCLLNWIFCIEIHISWLILYWKFVPLMNTPFWKFHRGVFITNITVIQENLHFV